MVKRELVWEVSQDGMSIVPATPQDGGVQGDHNVTRAIFKVAEGSAWADPANAVYIECDDGAGNIDPTEQLPVVDGKVSYLLPRAWTQYGGTVTLRLVAEGPGVEGEQAYSPYASVRFESRQNAMHKVDGLMKGRLAHMEQQMTEQLERAEDAAEDAAESARQANIQREGAQIHAEQAKTAAKQAEKEKKNAGAAASAAGESSLAAANSATAAELAADRAEDAAKTIDDAREVAGNAASSAVTAATAAGNAATQATTDAQKAEVARNEAVDAKTVAGNAANAAERYSDTAGTAKQAAEQAAASAAISANAAQNAAIGTVRFTEQELTDEQKAQARNNIGAGLPPLRFTVEKEDGAYTSSKTFQELSDAYAENRILICEFAGADLPLRAANDIFFEFASNVGGSRTVVDILDNAVQTAARVEIPSIQIGDQMWGGEDEEVNVDFTDTINKMISDNFGVINVRDPEYGAIGDGVTDDTKAIQDALHAAEDKGLPLYIPVGNYLVSKTISTYTRDTESDKQSKVINIFGAGMGTKFITAEDFEGDYVFHIDVADAQPRQLWVHDFAIDLVADVSGIYFREIGMKSVVENLWITHMYDKDPTDTDVRAGIYCRMATVTTFQRIKVYGNRKRFSEGHENIGIVCAASYSTKFIDCDIIFCKWAIYLSGGSNNLIEHCRIDENEYGVYQNSSANAYMDDTRAYPRDGKNFVGTFRNLTIRGNRFENNNKQAVFLCSFGTGTLNYLCNAQITIADNDFSGLGLSKAFQSSVREVFRKAVHLRNCKGVVIENNAFSGTPYEDDMLDLYGNQLIGVSAEAIADAKVQKSSQNIAGSKVEDITIRGNVVITKPATKKIAPGEYEHLKDANGNEVYWKTNARLDTDFLDATGFVDDIEADQSSRYGLGDVSLALDSILAIQEGLIGGDSE